MDHDVPHELAPPADAARAQALTRELCVAIADVRRAGAALAERVREAHAARVWLALGYSSWGDYARDELGISRAQAYRLVEIAGTHRQLLDAARALGLSPAGDLGLSGRALRDLHGRVDELSAALAERLQTTKPGTAADAAAILRDVARDVRARPAPAANADPRLAAAHAAVTRLQEVAGELGKLILEIAPAYLADADVTNDVATFADDTGMSLDEALAHRRYAITGDPRCLHLHQPN